jgi:hypothetical protein
MLNARKAGAIPDLDDNDIGMAKQYFMCKLVQGHILFKSSYFPLAFNNFDKAFLLLLPLFFSICCNLILSSLLLFFLYPYSCYALKYIYLAKCIFTIVISSQFIEQFQNQITEK